VQRSDRHFGIYQGGKGLGGKHGKEHLESVVVEGGRGAQNQGRGKIRGKVGEGSEGQGESSRGGTVKKWGSRERKGERVCGVCKELLFRMN